MTISLRAETRRLRRAFMTILVGATPAAALQACDGGGRSTTGAGGHPAMMVPDAARDAASKPDADDMKDALPDVSADDASSDDASDASPDGATDAPSPPCDITYASIDAGPDAPEACVVQLPCGLPQGVSTQGCALVIGSTPFGCTFVEDAGCAEDGYSLPESGLLIAECIVCPLGSGRRTGARRRASSATRDGDGPLAAHFVRMAREEHAAITAFERLARELSRHDAPAALVSGATRSARDEARHTRVMHRLARRHGARLARPSHRARHALRVRPLLAVARENAVEGCVREALGALVLAWQTTHAADPELRTLLAPVARDELRHAALSMAVARWARSLVDERAQKRIDRSMTSALAHLRDACSPSPLGVTLGYPSPAVHRSLVDGLSRALVTAGILQS